MAARSGINIGQRKYTETLTTGSAEGLININHDLGTQDYTVYIEEVGTKNVIMCPVRPVDNLNSDIQTSFNPSRSVKITIIG